jgi:hypothetical protein
MRHKLESNADIIPLINSIFIYNWHSFSIKVRLNPISRKVKIKSYYLAYYISYLKNWYIIDDKNVPYHIKYDIFWAGVWLAYNIKTKLNNDVNPVIYNYLYSNSWISSK